MTAPAPDWPTLIAQAEALLRDIRHAAQAVPQPERPVGIAPPCPRHPGQPAGRCRDCEHAAVPAPAALRHTDRKTQ